MQSGLRMFGLGALLLLVIGAVAVPFEANRRAKSAEERFPPEGQFLSINDRRVHAVVRGEGPDLVLIHGSSGNARDFTFSIMDVLAEQFRVIAFDRPGLGYSDRLDFNAETISDQARHLAEAAAVLGAEQPIVLGQSYGGAVALAWAVDRPDRVAALVTVAAPSQPWTEPLSAYYKVTSNPVLAPIAVPIISATVSRGRVIDAVESVFVPQAAPPGFADHIGAGLILRPAALRANATQRANLLSEITTLKPRLPEISVPLEIVHGTADDTVGAERHARPLANQVSGANLTLLPGIGHMPHHVAQGDVIAAVVRAAKRAGLH